MPLSGHCVQEVDRRHPIDLTTATHENDTISKELLGQTPIMYTAKMTKWQQPQNRIYKSHNDCGEPFSNLYHRYRNFVQKLFVQDPTIGCLASNFQVFCESLFQ